MSVERVEIKVYCCPELKAALERLARKKKIKGKTNALVVETLAASIGRPDLGKGPRKKMGRPAGT